MTVKSSISLTDDQFAFAKALVDAGQYPSLSAVLQQGIEVLRQRQDDALLERQALRALLDARRSAQTVSAEAFDDRLEEMLAAKLRAHGLDT